MLLITSTAASPLNIINIYKKMSQINSLQCVIFYDWHVRMLYAFLLPMLSFTCRRIRMQGHSAGPETSKLILHSLHFHGVASNVPVARLQAHPMPSLIYDQNGGHAHQHGVRALRSAYGIRARLHQQRRGLENRRRLLETRHRTWAARTILM